MNWPAAFACIGVAWAFAFLIRAVVKHSAEEAEWEAKEEIERIKALRYEWTETPVDEELDRAKKDGT